MKTKIWWHRIVRSLFPVALLAISSTASAQGVCNDMQFTDVTLSAGINHKYVWPPTVNSSTPGGATAADVNGDGWLDLYAVQGDAGPNLLYINNQDGTFTEAAAARGAQLNGLYGTGASAADFDNDGDIDLGVSVYFENSRVLVNDGNGNFTSEIVLPFPFDERTFSSSWGDVDNDGLLELAIGMWVGRNGSHNAQGLYLYKNNGGTLQNYEFRTVPRIDSHIFAPRFADLNGDRLSDMHVVADYDETRVYMNIGGGQFDADWGYGGLNDMGHAIGDYDKDGDLDIFTTDIETNNGNTLWDNDGLGNFSNVSSRAGIADGGWAWAGAFGDLDLDADLDIYHVNGFNSPDTWKDNPSLLFMNNDDGTFTDVAACAGAGIALGSQGRGMHMFDYDNDGDLDIFVVNNRYMVTGLSGQDGEPVLLRNDTPRNGRHWLKVTLDGTPPMHRDGIGSRVYVQTGSTTQMHEMHASTNYLSQDAGHIAHFGLDTVSTADEVRAEWVTGDATVLSSVSGDQQISIPSPKATVSDRTPAIGQNVTGTSNESAPVEWEIGGSTFADPVTTSFSSGGTKEMKLLVYNTSMTQVVRTELIRLDVAGVAGTPELTTPTPGSTLPAGNVSFAWNSNGASVDDWQLLVGTSVGGNSLYDSGVLPVSTTAALVSGLPEDGSTVHVTLRWNAGGGTSELNYTYTAATSGGTGGVPMILSPANGATLAGSSETFTWSAEGTTGITRWRLEIGTTVGGTDLYAQSLATATTSMLVTGLPSDGSTVHVRLKWRIDGTVSFADYTYTATGGGPLPPAMTSPTPGSTLPAGDVSFAWNSNGTVVDDWQLLLGTSVGGSGLYDSGVLTAATTTDVVSGLPDDGSTIHATLRWNVGGVPSELNYTYTAYDSPPLPPPALTSPTPGSTLPAGDVNFAWDGNGTVVDDWQFQVGTSIGGNSLYDSGVLPVATTSALVSGLPEDGSTIHVTLRWNVGGVPSELNYTFTAAGGTSGVPKMLSPLDGSTLAGSSETFTWSADGTTGITRWRLEVGTTVGGTNLFAQSLATATTSMLVTGLPSDGSTVYVRLKWRIGGVVSFADYTYTATGGGSPMPAITSPAPGSTLPVGDANFAWNSNGATVDDWQLLLGTSVGGNTLYDSGVLPVTTTNAVVSGLPEDGSTIHVTLRWNVGGVPSELNYTYTASSGPGSGVPKILTPLEGTTLPGSSVTFTWSTEGAAVTNWRLEIGTTAGSSNLYGKSWTAATTSQLVTGLPTDGSIVYVKLKWKIGGTVFEANYVYTAALL